MHVIFTQTFIFSPPKVYKLKVLFYLFVFFKVNFYRLMSFLGFSPVSFSDWLFSNFREAISTVNWDIPFSFFLFKATLCFWYHLGSGCNFQCVWQGLSLYHQATQFKSIMILFTLRAQSHKTSVVNHKPRLLPRPADRLAINQKFAEHPLPNLG